MKKPKSLKSNQKGFTLIELIAVIVLLSVIATLAIISVSTIKSKVNEREYINLASTIETAAQGYAEETGVNKMFVQTLVDKGLVETDDETKQVYDPRDSSSLNCQVVKYENGEAKLSEDDDPKCDTQLLSDDAVKIQYTITRDPSSTPKDLPADTWFSEGITLSVKVTGTVDLDLTNAKYKWTSPLAPDKTYTEKELRIEDKYVNDTFQVTITIGGRKYTAYGKVKIDREPPKVFNLIDTDPENWSPVKKLQFELSDAESGIQAYQISLDGNTEPTTWVTVKPQGKNSDKLLVEKNLSSMREGENVYIWVKDMVGNVNKSDVSSGGDGDGAIQINNIDGVFDTVYLTGSPANTTYTQSVSLSGYAQDLKSGIVKWVCSSSRTAPASSSSQWRTVTATNNRVNITCPTAATANGEYYLHAMDKVGNIGTATYKVTNIDRVIDYVHVVDTQSGYREYSTLRGTAYDNKAGIVGYAFSTSSSKPSYFNTISKTNGTISYTYQVDSNRTYYFHVIDAAGNWSYDYVTPTNIVRELSYRGTLYSERSSYINESFRLSGAVAITGVYSDTGYANASLSGNYAYVSAYSGRTYTESYWDTCYSRSYSYSAYYEMKCSGRYTCNRGGYVSGERCTGRDYILTSNPRTTQTYTCKNGSWEMTSGRWPGTPCDQGYYRTGNNDAFNCNNPKGSCTNGATQTIQYGCSAWCYWSGDYAATCSGGMYKDYYCDRGDYLSYSSCYYCNGYNESYNSRTGQCEYRCQKYYDYWQYNVTIYYYVLK